MLTPYQGTSGGDPTVDTALRGQSKAEPSSRVEMAVTTGCARLRQVPVLASLELRFASS
jgi:hypothetical protein